MYFQKISKTSIILYFIFYFSPIFDALTGFFVLNGFMSEGALFTPSQLGKIISVVLMLVAVVHHSNKDVLSKIICFIFYIILLECVSAILYDIPIYGFLYGFVQLYKVVYLILTFFFIDQLLKKNILSTSELMRLIINSALIYSVILLISTFLGVSTGTYDEGAFGTKGVFASGNGLSIYLGFSSFLSLYNYFKIKKCKKNFFAFLMIWLSCTIVGTKASIIFLFINSFMILKYSRLIVKLFILILLLFSLWYLIQIFFNIFEVVLWRYQRSENLLAFFASGRDNYINDAFKIYDTNGIKALKIFFGSGAFVSFRPDINNTLLFDTLENDFYDIFFMYGVNMLLLYFMFFLKYIFKGVLQHKLFFVIGFLTVIGYSILAGHTLFNTMSGLGLVFFPLLIKYDKKTVARLN